MSIWEPDVNSFIGVDTLLYESISWVQGMSAPNMFSYFKSSESRAFKLKLKM